MVFVLGVIAFAICIGISIALHECGHMWVAKATGMKVRRYYIGFGPKIFSWRRGETEPKDWTVQMVDHSPNLHGTPGLYGNCPDAEICLDNVIVTPN